MPSEIISAKIPGTSGEGLQYSSWGPGLNIEDPSPVLPSAGVAWCSTGRTADSWPLEVAMASRDRLIGFLKVSGFFEFNLRVLYIHCMKGL